MGWYGRRRPGRTGYPGGNTEFFGEFLGGDKGGVEQRPYIKFLNFDYFSTSTIFKLRF